MSLSSIGSNEEKIEVNEPSTSMPPGLPPPPQPPLPPLPPMPWQLPQVHNQAYQNAMVNNVYNQQYLNTGQYPPGFAVPNSTNVFTHNDELKESMFVEALESVISELKFIMKKDLCKKMVQDTAFNTYDEWWVSEQVLYLTQDIVACLNV
jgi:hypothetical protein